MLEIKNLSKSYGGKKALENISLKIPSGQMIGLFGENGAGKTTLIKSVFGFHRYSGEITLDGAPVTYKNIARLSFATCEHSFFPDAKSAQRILRNAFSRFSKKAVPITAGFFRTGTEQTAAQFFCRPAKPVRNNSGSFSGRRLYSYGRTLLGKRYLQQRGFL